MKEELNSMIEEAQTALDQMKMEAVKFTQKDNASAGTKVRANAMTLVNLCKQIRLKVSEIKNA